MLQVFTRASHRSIPIEVITRPRPGVPGRFRVQGEEFSSARSLMSRLTGQARTPFSRYFRDIPDEEEFTGWGQEPPKAKAPGIDLVARGHEVRKIFFAKFSGKVMASGMDPEDVLQEIYQGLLIRNNGTCPFDPSKSSFGHYVYMVADCVINNHYRKTARRREVEQVGVSTPSGDSFEVLDLSEASEKVDFGRNLTHYDSSLGTVLSKLHELLLDVGVTDTDVYVQTAALLHDGLSHDLIAQSLDVPKSKLSKVIKTLRAVAAAL